MQAAVGDRFHARGTIVGQPERTGEIIEVWGAGGEPPYLVRFDDGHTSLVSPGPGHDHRAPAQERRDQDPQGRVAPCGPVRPHSQSNALS
jgi:Domain of unknown function (DUF1918)